MGTARAFRSFFRDSLAHILVGNRYYYAWVGFLLAIIAVIIVMVRFANDPRMADLLRPLREAIEHARANSPTH